MHSNMSVFYVIEVKVQAHKTASHVKLQRPKEEIKYCSCIAILFDRNNGILKHQRCKYPVLEMFVFTLSIDIEIEK